MIDAGSSENMLERLMESMTTSMQKCCIAAYIYSKLRHDGKSLERMLAAVSRPNTGRVS